MAKESYINIRVDADLKEKVTRVADKKGQTLSKLVRGFFRDYLSNNKDLL